MRSLNLTDGEYYGKYDGSYEQRSFALFLREYDIVSRYTMLGKPSMNDVVEHTHNDMVRSMINHSSLPESL